MSVFDRIADWFGDVMERRAVINKFNMQSKHAWDEGFPFMLKAETTRGDYSNRHNFSRRKSGFRISAMTGGNMNKEKCSMVAMVILSNQTLVRQLMRLGYDTLEVYGGDTGYSAPLAQLLIS